MLLTRSPFLCRTCTVDENACGYRCLQLRLDTDGEFRLPRENDDAPCFVAELAVRFPDVALRAVTPVGVWLSIVGPTLESDEQKEHRIVLAFSCYPTQYLIGKSLAAGQIACAVLYLRLADDPLKLTAPRLTNRNFRELIVERDTLAP